MLTKTFLKSFLLLFVLSPVFFACQDGTGPIDNPPGNNNPWGISVEKVASISAGESETLSGNISGGVSLGDLDWADLSNVACFPGTRFIEFQGKQEFYEVTIPQGAELIVTVTPTDAEPKRINVYGYIHFDGSNVPPIEVCTSCEAGYPLYVGTPDLTEPGEPQDISFAQAVNRDFTALIAVSGAQGVESGAYDIEFALEPM